MSSFQSSRSASLKLTAVERKAIFSLSGIFALRMLGLFLVLPVLAIYAANYQYSTPLLVGTALGIYGLTQALLQLPVGFLSDRFGRKKLITIGLLLFALGSVIAALAPDIHWLIAGRAVQGGGAVSAAVLALTADLTRDEQRTKAMALIGMSIGLVFLVSMTIGPPLAKLIGLSGLFWIISGLALGAIAVLHLLVPNTERRGVHRDVLPAADRLKGIVSDPQLLRLDCGIFSLHLVLTALFVVLPGQLVRLGGMEVASHWKIYLPLIILSVVGMAPLVMLSSRQHLVIRIFKVMVSLLLLALLGLGVAASTATGFGGLLIALWLFFVAFNGLEAMLPSLVSRVAPAGARGTAIGVYNTLQFLGVFVGGVMAGLLSQRFGSGSVFWFCALVSGAWLLLTLISPAFTLLESRTFDLSLVGIVTRPALIDRIESIRGVREVTVVSGEPLAYLKVDEKELDVDALEALADMAASQQFKQT